MKRSIENYKTIISKLDFAEIILKRTSVCDFHITNQEFCKLLEITDRDAQSIRSLNLIPFKYVGSIIVYLLDDIRDYVNRVYVPKSSINNA